MKKIFITFTIILTVLITINGQSPLGFNYQAVVRDSAGEIVADKTVGMRISLLKQSTEGEIVYSETFTPSTNEFGLVNIVIGSGVPQEGSFSDIDWSDADYFIKVEIDVSGGSDYDTMGTSQLLSVPYAQHAFSVRGGTTSWTDSEDAVTTEKKVGIGEEAPAAKLQIVASDGDNDEEPLFEVINKQGERVFAVFNNRVEVIIDEDDTEKTKGGFAVSGRTTTKQDPRDIFFVQPGLTQVFVDEQQNTKTKGGFAVSGRTTTKQDPRDILLIQPGLSQFFVDEQQNTKTKGGFAVSGRTTTKGELYDLLHIQPNRTELFIKPLSGKQDPENFSISLLDQDLTSLSLFEVSGTSTFIHTPLVMEGYFEITFYVYIKDPVGNPLPQPGVPIELIGGGEVYSGITNNNGIAVFYNIPAGLDYFYVIENLEGNIINLDRDIIIPALLEL